MLNFLKFLIKTNVTHYSKENYDYFFYLQHLKSSIHFEKNFVSEILSSLFDDLYKIHLGIEYDKSKNYDNIHFLFIYLKNDNVFKSNPDNLQYLYNFLLEFYKFKIFNIDNLNSFLIFHLDLNKNRYFLSKILEIIHINKHSILMNNILKYKEFNEFIFILIDFFPVFYLNFISIYEKDIKLLFNEYDFHKLFTILSKKEDIIKIFPADFLSLLFQKISEKDKIYLDLLFFILKQCEEFDDYHIAKEKILIDYPIYSSIFEEYETRLNIKNF